MLSVNRDDMAAASDRGPWKNATPRDLSESVLWLPSASMARRKRQVYIAVQVMGAALVGATGVLLAFLMLLSWPASLGPIRQSALDIFSPIVALFRVPFAPEFAPFLSIALLAAALYPAVLYWFQLLLAPTGAITPFRRMWDICKAVCTATAGLYIFGLQSLVHTLPGGNFEVVLFFIYLGAIALFGTILFRSGFLSLLFLLRSMGIGHTRLAIVTATEPDELRRTVDRYESDYKLVGTITLEPPAAGCPLKDHLGALADLPQIINREYLDEILLAIDPGEMTVEQRLALIENCWKLGTDLKMITPFHPYFRATAQAELLGDLNVLRIAPLGLYASRAQLLKRLIDVCVSATALIVTSPILVISALLIKATSPGPVLFVQERAGLHGRAFRILKFRTMRANASTSEHIEAQRLLIQNGAPSGIDKNGRPIYGKVADDPRITAAGKWLRRTSIDELPQLWNILRGEMSLVGPRPAVMADLDNFKAWHFQRHGIRPGLTGLWQVSGRSSLSFDQMVALDLKYIEDWSIWFDLKILLKTVPAVLSIGRAH